MMKVLIDIGHPAQVHQFKYVYKELVSNGHDVLFTTKDKDIALNLLDAYKIPYNSLGRPRKGLFNKILYIPNTCIKFFKIILSYKPNIILSRGSIHACWVSYLLKKKHITFADTEHVGLADTLTVPFVKTKLTAYSYYKNLGKNHLKYSGNIELFYLHPNRFNPNPEILFFLNVIENEKYVIVRFVSWDAHHDVGMNGITLSNKIKLVKNLSQYAKVFITSEEKLPEELEKFKIKIPPEMMHDAINYASLLVGESATMASEAAMLGVPSIYIDEVGRGYTDDEGDFGLVYNYKPKEQVIAITKAIELIQDENKDYYQNLAKQYVSNKIDMTAFTVWFIESYPGSIKIMKENPDYQYRFK